MNDRLMPVGLTSLDAHVKKYKGNVKAAAAALSFDYYQLWRWYKRKMYAPEFGSSRKVLASLGIDLPRQSGDKHIPKEYEKQFGGKLVRRKR